MSVNLKSDYVPVEENGKIGYREKGCGCAGKKADNTIHQVNSNLLLKYNGVVSATINGVQVMPGRVILGLDQETFNSLAQDKHARFSPPSEKEMKTLLGKFGK